VEFAKQLHQEPLTPPSPPSAGGEGGVRGRLDATVEASRLRLRPILMTSFAFIFGVFPLVVATGAGAEMRHSLGAAVLPGMFGVTLFGIFLTPVFFYVIAGFSELPVFSTPKARRFSVALRLLLNAVL